MSSSTQVWRLDELVAEKKSMDEKVRLEAPVGQLRVRFSTLGSPRRATFVPADEEELDLEPDAGSAAALHEDRVRAHPDRYAALLTLGGAGKVVVPIILATLLARFAFSLPWPDWSLPLPDLPDRSLPGWLRWILDHLTYIWPVVLAFVLARAEIRRRRQQDQKRKQLREE